MESWDSTKAYGLHDIVTYNGHAFYSLKDNNSDVPVYLGLSNLRDKPTSWADEYHFTWQGSYSSDNNTDAEVKSIEYGDGYKKETPIGPSNDPVQFTYQLINLTDKESNAILSFLSGRGGEVFIVDLPFPYSRQLYFQCSDFTHTRDYENVNTISAQFVETFYCPKPTYDVASSYELCGLCNFDYNDMIKYYVDFPYINSILPYEDAEGYGDELLIFQAWNYEDNRAEDFLVKTTRKKLSGKDVLDYNPYSDNLNNTSFLHAPFNIGGIVIDYVVLAKYRTDNTNRPSPNSQRRTYYLNGQLVELWVETYGPFNTINRLRRSTDAIVTPQLFPFAFTHSPTANTPTENELFTGGATVIDPKSYGLFISSMAANSIFWTMDTMQFSATWTWAERIATGPDVYRYWVEKILTNTFGLTANYENGYILNPSPVTVNTLSSDSDLEYSSIAPAGGGNIICALFAPANFNLVNNTALALNQLRKIGVRMEIYFERVFNSIINTPSVPFGTLWNGYGPNGRIIGYGYLDLGFTKHDDLESNAYGNTGFHYKYPSVPFASTYYLQKNSIQGMSATFTRPKYKRKTIPVWISKTNFDGSAARCVDGFVKHYPKSFVNEAFRLYV